MARPYLLLAKGGRQQVSAAPTAPNIRWTSLFDRRMVWGMKEIVQNRDTQ